MTLLLAFLLFQDPPDANKVNKAIDDGIHPPVVVAEVAFQALLAIFSMNAKEFERDGVLIRKSETNPIYALILDKPDIRIRLQNRFRRLATEREWLGQ